MGDKRPELSRKNIYYIPKHRYYELMHYCLQYNDMLSMLNALSLLPDMPIVRVSGGDMPDPVESVASKRAEIKRKIQEIDECIGLAAEEGYEDYLFLSVCKGESYTKLTTLRGMDMPRNKFYEMYREFFWVLDKVHR